MKSRPKRFSRPKTELILRWSMLNLLLADEINLSRLASQDESESRTSKLEVSIEEESKKFSSIKSKMKSLDWSVSVDWIDNWTEWNLRRCVSSVLWEINFSGQLGQLNFFENSEDEEIKEQAEMCLLKQTPLCLKEAWQNGQGNIG